MAQYLNLKPTDPDKLSPKVNATITWAGRFLLPKWDGCMCLVGFFNGKPDFVLSRDGVPVKSMDHIYEDILKRWPAVADIGGGTCFIGEAWVPGMAFNNISGMFRRHTPQTALHHAVFDMVQYSRGTDGAVLLASDTKYERRLEWLRIYDDAQGNWSQALFRMPIICEDKAHAMRYAKNLKALGGYDGCIAADPSATYSPGSGSNGEFLKVKPLQSFTLEVVDVVSGVGEKTGRVTAALQVRFKSGVCGVGTGFSNADAELWTVSKEYVIGRLIEVECMGVYAGPEGMMREPRFVGFRSDVIKADY